jgi:transposase
MAWRRLTTAQWETIRPHLPPPKARPRGGRPRVEDRRCFAGILWILWTGAPWSELPRRYGSPSTCWRRLQQWEETGVLLKLWRAFLAQLHDQEKLRWDECFADGSFVPAKRGGPKSAPPSGARAQSGWFWSRARGPPLGAVPGGGFPCGGYAPRKNARHRGRRAAGEAWTPPQAARPLDCGSRLR